MSNDKEKKGHAANTSNRIDAESRFGTTRIQRYGRFVTFEADRTPEQHRELQIRMKELAAELPEIIRAKSLELEKILASFNSFDIIAHIAFANLFINPEDYKEYSHPGKPAYPEYVALLCLKHESSIGRHVMLDYKNVTPIEKLLDEIFEAAMWLTKSSGAGPDRDIPSDIEMAQFLTRMHGLGVRNPAYTHHLYEVLQELFSPFDEPLKALAGFCIRDAVSLSIAASWYPLVKLAKRHRRASEEIIEEFRKLVMAYRKRKYLPDDIGDRRDLVKQLAKLSTKRLDAMLKNMSISWIFVCFGDTCSFSPGELAMHASIPEEGALKFAERLSINFGDVPADFYLPSPDHQLRNRPMLHHDGRYLCPSPVLLDWAIQSAMESSLKDADGKLWDRYVCHRHNYLLQKAISLIRAATPQVSFEANLEYQISNSDMAELDGLGIYDSALFLVEAKGHSFSAAARRGGLKRLERHVKEIFGDAYNQCIRARSFIQNNEKPSFKRKDGSIFVLDKSNIRTVFLISISLEPLGFLSSNINSETDFELFQKGDIPWIVNIYDLMVITEFIDIPALLPHYIKRRIRAANQGIFRASDELDLFGYYLNEGLYLEGKNSSGPDFMQLMTYTTQFDDYYFFKTGARKTPVPKPRQKMPDLLRILIWNIEKSNFDGRIDIQMQLLDLDSETRERVSRQILKTRQEVKTRPRIVGFAISGPEDGGWGISYYCGPEKETVVGKMKSDCLTKREEFKTRTWTGIAEVGATDFQICSLCWES